MPALRETHNRKSISGHLHMEVPKMGNPKMDGFCWGKSDPKWMMTGGTPMTQDTSILSPTYGILSRGPRLQSKKGPIFDDAFGEASGCWSGCAVVHGRTMLLNIQKRVGQLLGNHVEKNALQICRCITNSGLGWLQSINVWLKNVIALSELPGPSFAKKI